MNDALYLTLQVFGKSLGTKQVVEICQRFILDSIPSETVSVPLPVTTAKKFKIIKTVVETETETESPKIVLPVIKSAKKITPVNTTTLNRNFKKMAQETHFLPVGTILIISESAAFVILAKTSCL